LGDWVIESLGDRVIGSLIGVTLVALAAVAYAAPRPSPGCAAASLDKGRPLERSLTVDGVKRTYLLDVPDGVEPGKPLPLLLDFHGFQHSAAGVWRVSEFKDLAARDPFITVYPDGLEVDLLGRSGRGWQMFSVEGNRDLVFTRALLDEMERRYCIDRNRVYATGFSNGGFFSNVLACTMSDRIAAVAPVGAGRITVPCAPSRAVPVIIVHGRQDELVRATQAREARDAWVEMNGCREHLSNGCEIHRECRNGAEVRYCEFDIGHRWPPGATQQIWKFLEARELPNAKLSH
jgi:polyhydroxybutyrate depolymerase